MACIIAPNAVQSLLCRARDTCILQPRVSPHFSSFAKTRANDIYIARDFTKNADTEGRGTRRSVNPKVLTDDGGHQGTLTVNPVGALIGT